MSDQRGRGHRRGPTLAAYLRKTLDECEGQMDAPIGPRIEIGLDIPRRDFKAVVDRLDESAIITGAVENVFALLDSMIEDEEGDPSQAAWAARIKTFLTAPVDEDDDEGIVAMREFLRNLAMFGFLEGWLFGTGAAINRINARRERVRTMPRR